MSWYSDGENPSKWYLYHSGDADDEDFGEDEPAAEVVEVVRCKDCVYYEANSCFNRQWDFESSTEIPLVREIDFCSYGERKDGAGE